jgi:hypothetical protein
LAKTAVVVERKDATDLSGDVVVVHLFRVRRAADPTPATLSQDDPPDLAFAARKVVDRLHGLAVRAMPKAVWRLGRCFPLVSMLFEHALAVTPLGPLAVAGPAVTATAPFAVWARMEVA